MQRTLCANRSYCGSLFFSFVIIALLFALPVRAQVSGVSYSLTPSADYIWFSDDAALNNDGLVGGQLGFGFGRFIELRGIYMVNRSMETDFSAFSIGNTIADPLFATLAPRTTKFQRYGGNIKFNIGHGSVFPYVSLGAGVLSFKPDSLNSSETIYLNGGVGLQYSVKDRYTVVVQANSLNYRYNPASTLLSAGDLATLGLTAGDFATQNVSALSASAGLQLYLGGKSQGQLTDMDRALQRQLSSGWRGVGLRVEPVAGSVNFSDALGYRNDQRMVGVAAGIDMGAYAGIRGFYWRGTEDDSWTKFDDLEAWGGELQLAFQTSAGLTPFVSVGGGQMNVRSDYVGNGSAPLEDRPFALAGAGVVLPLGSALSVVGTAKTLLMSSSGIDNLSDPGSVKSNVMLSVSMSFGFGGSGGESTGSVFGREMATAHEEQKRVQSDLAAAQARIDSLAAIVAAQQMAMGAEPVHVQSPVSSPLPSTVAAKEKSTKNAPSSRDSASTGTASVAGAARKWITVPIPEEGEIYLRFGKPGGVSVETMGGDALQYFYDPATGQYVAGVPPTAPSNLPGGTTKPAAPGAVTAEQIQNLMRQALREENARTAAKDDSASAAVAKLQNALDARFVEMESRLEQQRTDMAKQAAAQQAEIQRAQQKSGQTQVPLAPVAEAQSTRDDDTPVEVDTRTASRGPSGQFESVRPLMGYNFDTPKQLLLGVRAEYKLHGKPYRLMPEYLLGTGDGITTHSFNLNAVYGFGAGEKNRPYAGAGIGVMDRGKADFAFNMLVGSERKFDFGTAFAEFMTQNFFDNNRLLLGYRFGL